MYLSQLGVKHAYLVTRCYESRPVSVIISSADIRLKVEASSEESKS